MNLSGFEKIEIQATNGGKSYLTKRPYVTVSSTSVGFSRKLVNDLHSPGQVEFYKGQKGTANENKIAIVPVEEGGSQFLNSAKAHKECKKRVDLKNKQILQLFQKDLLMGFGTYYLIDAEVKEEGDELFAVVDMSKAVEHKVEKHRG